MRWQSSERRRTIFRLVSWIWYGSVDLFVSAQVFVRRNSSLTERDIQWVKHDKRANCIYPLPTHNRERNRARNGRWFLAAIARKCVLADSDILFRLLRDCSASLCFDALAHANNDDVVYCLCHTLLINQFADFSNERYRNPFDNNSLNEWLHKSAAHSSFD